MKKFILIAIAVACAAVLPAQNLTPAQKEADFTYLVSLYDTYYAPLTWKNQVFGFNALDQKPWLTRVAETRTDLEFYDVCVEYIASLRDTHVAFSLPSDFLAQLGFGVDIYDGSLLIEGINRTLLPIARFPFGIGDELVSIDDEDAQSIVDRFVKYTPQGNPRASRRMAAARLTVRPQSRMPFAAMVGDTAKVVIRRQSGALETYTISWTKTGTPLEVGPLSAPAKAKRPSVAAQPDLLEELQYSGISEEETNGVLGYGARNPVFVAGLPTNFVRRFGGNAADFYYSGVLTWDELKIGYIRIPNYSPASIPLALAQFEAEIAFMNANTDGLIIDEMRNTGGNLCFGENIAARLHTSTFQATGFDLRAYWIRTLGFYNSWISSIATGAPQEVINQYELLYKEMLAANREGRVVTNTLPLCSSSLTRTPLLDANGQPIGYKKPIMVIIDDFSTSTADSFAGMMQDSGRALLYGMRTNGAGGNNISVAGGAYTEAFVGMTLALQSRPNAVEIPGFPASKYIENAGVHPQVEKDYMTKQNLLGNGAQFVHDFTEAMAAYIRQLR